MNNIVCWSDVLLFNDGSFELFIYPVEIVEEFRKEFSKHYFSTEKELERFFGNEDVIYDCDNFEEAAKEKFKKHFKSLLLDTVKISDSLMIRIQKEIDLTKCGGYINGFAF